MDQDALGTDIGLGPGHIVLDGIQLPPPKKGGTAAPSIFGPSFVVKRSPISAAAELLFAQLVAESMYFAMCVKRD